MVRQMATLLGIAASIIAPQTDLPKPKPVNPPGGTIIVGILPGEYRKIITDDQTLDNNNNLPQDNTNGNSNNIKTFEEPDTTTPIPQTADERYNELKGQLDARFERMFTLKREIDSTQSSISEKWEEYNALRQSYERQLQRLIADWVMNLNYSRQTL